MCNEVELLEYPIIPPTANMMVCVVACIRRNAEERNMSSVFDEIAVWPGTKKTVYSRWSEDHQGWVSLCKKETTRGTATVCVGALEVL